MKTLPYSVSIRSLRRPPWARSSARSLDVPELRQLRKLLRMHIMAYRIAVQTPLCTATERRKSLGKIKTAAMRLIENPSRQWAERFLRSLDDVDANTRAVVYRHLWSMGIRWTAIPGIKRQLGDLYYLSVYHDEAYPAPGRLSRAQHDRVARFEIECLPTVRALASIDSRVLVSRQGKWRDPAQANLVAALEPVWCRVTGRSAGLTSIDKVGAQKRCRFAEWLKEILTAIDLPAPSLSRVADVVREK
jgi:hypothetical protein